ncbi:MAG: radical SAM family heme chaperone HemW [Tissierellia bacterium]|nr:radical SAM family heme chaperone HemW [Tissierellia bacterium]
MKNNLALYIHLPFCSKKCTYCDFLSFSASQETRRLYLESLLKEMDLYRDLFKSRQITSLYFGGGTPSLLSARELEYLLQGVFKRVTPRGELDFEMNPDDVNWETLDILKNFGDFRISLGSQSFDEELLKLFGRTHGVQEIFKAVETIRKSGFKNISLDLIYAVEKKFTMTKNLEALSQIIPEHLSCYALELHPTRPLAKILKEPDEELYIRDWQHLKDGLKKLGYERYEISSFAKDKNYSQHNLNYWQGGDYLGLGLGAHGLLSPRRYANERNLKKYFHRLSQGELPIDEQILLTDKERRFEIFMLGLRVVEGIDLKNLFPLTPQEEKAIAKHKKNGLMQQRGELLGMTEEGFDLFNYVLVDFM